MKILVNVVVGSVVAGQRGIFEDDIRFAHQTGIGCLFVLQNDGVAYLIVL